MGHATFQVGDLTAVVGDNEAYEGHRAGYNGIHRLVHKSQAASVLLEPYGGMNLEHYFDGQQDLTMGDDVFFEPRRAPMEFRKIADDEAELHQPPTPTFHVESWTRFKFVAPHYVDFSFRLVPRQHAFRNGYIGVFWANYVNGPEDKAIYFRSAKKWEQHSTPKHNVNSTVRHKDDRVELKFAAGARETLYQNFSPMAYDEPFYYGNFGAHVFILMFDRTEGIRFTQSPSGGGAHRSGETNCPAWDWQFIVPKYDVLQEYGFRARVAYRERGPRAGVLAEVEKWRASLK